MQAQLWSVSGLAVELGRDRRTIAKALEGLTPDEESDKRGGSTVRRWRLARVLAHLYSADGGQDFADQRQRLAAAQAEKVEHENALRRGSLANLADVERVWAGGVSAARSKLLGLPAKLSPRLVNIGDANLIAAAIRTGLYAALGELADYEPAVEPERPDADAEEDVPAVGAAAAADREPVGGPRKTAVQRKRRGAGPVED